MGAAYHEHRPLRYAATMRHAAIGVVLATVGVAHAAPWTVTLEGGGEADTNVQRVETGPGIDTARVGAGVLLVGGKLGHKAALAGGAYGLMLSTLSRVVADPATSTENVTLVTADARFLRPLANRPVSLGVAVLAADALPITEAVGARTFRNLGADALLSFDGGEGTTLSFAAGARSFTYKVDRQFDWVGPVVSARLDRALWQPAGGARSLEIATFAAFEDRTYASTALANACPAGAPPSDMCSAGTSIERRDRVSRVGAEITWTGTIVAAAGYQLSVIDSNSYGQSLIRHRATVSTTTALPGGLYGTALGQLQLDQFPDGLVLKTALNRSEFTSLEDENRSSVQIRLARPVAGAWSIEGRGAIWRNLGNDAQASFRRASLYAGLIYTR